MNEYDFALDTSKIENIITDLTSEKSNMELAITDMYKIIDDMNTSWEGQTYQAAKKEIDKFKEPLDNSVSLVSKIIELLDDNKTKAEESINLIKQINDKSRE